MTGENDSGETNEEYQNKRIGCEKLLEIRHTVLFVRSARNGDWSAKAKET